MLIQKWKDTFWLSVGTYKSIFKPVLFIHISYCFHREIIHFWSVKKHKLNIIANSSFLCVKRADLTTYNISIADVSIYLHKTTTTTKNTNEFTHCYWITILFIQLISTRSRCIYNIIINRLFLLHFLVQKTSVCLWFVWHEDAFRLSMMMICCFVPIVLFWTFQFQLKKNWSSHFFHDSCSYYILYIEFHHYFGLI